MTAGGGAGFLMIETQDPRELNEILDPAMLEEGLRRLAPLA